MREPLSRERVLTAAVALADTDGIGALTMRRLAAELGVEAMSLYYHLPGKEGLLDGLAETIVDEIARAVEASDALADRSAARRRGAATSRAAASRTNERKGDWRARLQRWFLAARAVMVSHPWAPELMNSRRQAPPGVYAYYERILGLLIEAGFSYHLAHRAMHAFGSMPLGFVQETFNPNGEGAAPTEAEFAAMAEHLPHMAAMVAAEMHRDTDPILGWCDSQAEFEFTLDLLLDGLERAR